MKTANQPDGPASASTEADYHVALFSAAVDRALLTAALRDALQLTEIDARIRARNVPGLLPERLSKTSAERVVAAVSRLGSDAEVVRSEDIPDLQHAPKAHHVRCTPAALEVAPDTGDAIERISWERVALISVADVPLGTSHHYVAPRTVMFRGTPRKNDAESSTVVRGPELWLVFVAPFGVLHVDHREMNYEYLGSRMTSSATTNFRELLADLRRHAPGALLTPPAQAFINHGSVEEYRFETPEQHREIVELHTLLALRSQRNQASSEIEGQPVQPGETAVTDSVPTDDPSAQLVRLHETLHSEIDELKTWSKEADEYGRPQFGQLGDRVRAIRKVVAEHIALEEEGGYMSGPLKAAPQLGDRAEALRAEHPRLLAEFDNLAANLRDSPCKYDCWSSACRDFRQLLDELERHEQAEQQFWQAAFGKQSSTEK